MTSLATNLRDQLKNTVRAARRIAEDGAGKSLEQLGVAHAKAPAHLSPTQTMLRNALRAHGRQVGDLRNHSTGTQAIGRLTIEMAYEHWHRMLFARFLAENETLIEPDSGMAISLDECQELARGQNLDWLALASRSAQTMLPQIFRVGDPVLDVNLPPETRSQLDDLLKSLPRDVFVAEDSLGWVYQFWQADNKKAINDAEIKIGADELPAVTQLFTEDYMVWFLLHNTLGAWWAGKVLAKNPDLAKTATSEAELRTACSVGGIEWTYLRFVREGDLPWRPAAGTFNGWPASAKDITLLDPSMGSGHFLVFALPILAALRAQEEGLKPEAAIKSVLRDNLYGLELDPRCTQIAAFNLALAAWKHIGYRKLPALHLACSGLSLGVSKDEWLKLAERVSAELPVAPERDLLGIKQENLFSDATRRGFERLYELFAKAPVLGSLIQPRASGDLIEKGFADLEPLLAKVLTKADSAELSEMAVAAQGLAKAAELLSRRFTLIATNVPFLGNRNQGPELLRFSEQYFERSKVDLSTTMLDRLISSAWGETVATISPQAWLQQIRYRPFLGNVVLSRQIHLVIRYGSGAFQTITGEAVSVCATIISTNEALPTSVNALDLSAIRGPEAKAGASILSPLALVDAAAIRKKRMFLFENPAEHPEIGSIAFGTQGVKTGDDNRFVVAFWELKVQSVLWRPYIGTASKQQDFTGRNRMLRWENDGAQLIRSRRDNAAYGKVGVAVNQMGQLLTFIYTGEAFDSNVAPIVCHDVANTAALFAFFRDPIFAVELGKLEGGMKVNNGTLLRVPFDLPRWRRVAAEKFPNGLPRPHSDDPTQWLFSGNLNDSDSPLHVAAARIIGYRWPRQTGSSFPNCSALVSDGLEKHEDDDGIVPLTALKGEAGAAGRIVALLQDAYGAEWSAARLDKLLAEVGAGGASLDDWLRDHFFESHCELFHQRPFVWHVWDGRRDGFNVLVNYHMLAAGNGEGKRLLEKLAHTYLGDWITEQRRASEVGTEGAEARLAAAEHLKGELESILSGEPPYDLFVRWKPLAEQAIGWEPDINDGVRMNIRPFMTARPFGARARNACILRASPKIKWDKDGGKEPERAKQDFPWFWAWEGSTSDFAGGATFDGNRWNDLHYTTKAKRAARERAK